MNFDIALETAEWLGKEEDIVKLNKLKEFSENKKFYVTVWGHYSAGKSKLLNNLLEREVLPVQTRETTAVLTYIQFGEYEECVIVYENGTAKKCQLNILKDVFQNTVNFEEVGKIDHIEVYVKNDLLKSGLILVDTPGANSIIKKHQNLAASAIEQSGRIIYVLGNSPSNVDKQFIKQISDCGIKIDFVRTKCDRFIEAEENVEDSLMKEKMDISEFIGKEVKYVPVSNEKNSKWFSNIDKIKSLLENVSSEISEEMEQANILRLSVFYNNYLKELINEKEQMENLLNGNVDDINEKMSKCESEIKLLNEMISDGEEKLQDKIKSEKNKTKIEIDRVVETQTEKFKNELVGLKPNQNIQNEVREIYANYVTNAVKKFQLTLNSHFDMLIKEETDKIVSSIEDGEYETIPPTYSEVQQENSIILDMYKAKLVQARDRIAEILVERENNNNEYGIVAEEFDDNSYKEALKLLDEELSNIPTETALRLSENQGLQPSEVFKKIGDVADLGLLLLPGDVIFKGIEKIIKSTKLAQVMHKGKEIEKVLKKVGKNANVIDKVRDTAYAVNTVMGKRRYSTQSEREYAEKLVETAANKGQQVFDTYKENKREGNILDALSISYWTEKIGRQFDSPPKMEIDVQEEQRKNELRKQITQQQQKLSEERLQKKKELGLLQSKEQELKVLEQEEKNKKEAIENEIAKQEKYIKQQAEQIALDNYKKKYTMYYQNSIIQIANEMCEQYFLSATSNITIYVAGKNSEVINEVNNKKEQMEKLLELKENGNKDLEERLSGCTKLIEKVQMEVECA